MSFNIYKGEIYGLLAFNNLGLGALVDLMCRNINLDYGSVYLEEKLINNYLYSSGNKTSVEIISHRSRIVEAMSVIDNIFIINPDFNKQLIFSSSYKILEEKYFELTKTVEIELNPYSLISDLNPFERCVVALLKAIVSKAPLIICENLSNVLSANDLIKFHKLIKFYSSKGVSFAYICDHHEEAFQICNRAALLDCGRIIKKLDKQEMTNQIMREYVIKLSRDANVGNLLLPENSSEEKQSESEREITIKAENLNYKNIKNISFAVKKGDCLVLLDRDNNIFDDLIEAVQSTSKRGKKGISCYGKTAYISENPIAKMLFPNMSYLDNLCFILGNSQPEIWYSERFKQSIAREYYEELGEDIFSDNIEYLSAPSLYNLVYYRAIIERAQVVFIKQPFAGSDMFLRTHIKNLIENLKERGIGVVILAINIADSLRIADELMLIQNGVVEQVFHKNEFQLISENRLTFT